MTSNVLLPNFIKISKSKTIKVFYQNDIKLIDEIFTPSEKVTPFGLCEMLLLTIVKFESDKNKITFYECFIDSLNEYIKDDDVKRALEVSDDIPCNVDQTLYHAAFRYQLQIADIIKIVSKN